MSFSAILKPSVVWVSRAQPLGRLATRKHHDSYFSAPHAAAQLVQLGQGPKRSAFSMTMTLALGTLTPTSTTVVETSMSISPLRKASRRASFSAAFMRRRGRG